MRRCRGTCCDPVHLRISPAELAAAARGEREVPLADAAFMADAFTFLQKSDHALHGRRDAGPFYLYRCRHHKPDGDCAVYHERPATCRAFPFGPCPFLGCELGETDGA